MVVLGLSQDGDTSALRSALTGAGLSLDELQVIGPHDSDESMARGISAPDIFMSDEGMNVPGLNPGGNRRQTFFRNESLTDRLGDFGIPESELDNFVEALERGKTLVAYFAKPETVDKVDEIFRGTNLANVRKYE